MAIAAPRPSRFGATGSSADKFIEKLTARVKGLKVAIPLYPVPKWGR